MTSIRTTPIRTGIRPTRFNMTNMVGPARHGIGEPTSICGPGRTIGTAPRQRYNGGALTTKPHRRGNAFMPNNE